jgi:hypothetical protein
MGNHRDRRFERCRRGRLIRWHCLNANSLLIRVSEKVGFLRRFFEAF